LPYADDIASASGGYHARLGRTPCGWDVPEGSIGPSVNCPGPYTKWGGYSHIWNGPYTTQVDIYLDAGYANTSPANDDSPTGKDCLKPPSTGATDPACTGTRFDYSSAINKSTLNAEGKPQFLRDFGFVVGTGQPGNTCSGWTVNAQQNVNRNSAFPEDQNYDPACIPDSGWYTFKHSFSENGAGNLEVKMEIFPAGGQPVPDWTWIIQSGPPGDPDEITTVGCNRYGWFSNQEIFGLPIDNAKMEGGCAAPRVTEGQISPTQTTCQLYRDGTAALLGQVQYTTTKGGKLNALSPGVFFYYGKVSGTAGQTVEITQTHTGTAPVIPIQNGQVVLYNATTCKVLKWTATSSDGTATGTLPSSGDFIIGVKYSPSSLKGADAPNPSTVTYSFGTTDPATIDLVKK
jgi:hypothetical protein